MYLECGQLGIGKDYIRNGAVEELAGLTKQLKGNNMQFLGRIFSKQLIICRTIAVGTTFRAQDSCCVAQIMMEMRRRDHGELFFSMKLCSLNRFIIILSDNKR